MNVFGMDLDSQTLLLGVIAGIPYGLLAVGLVLIYKVSRFVNFAQGALGAFGAAVVASLVVEYGVPYWAAFVIGIVVAAGVAAATEASIVRRLEGQPRMMGVVVTLLLSQFLLGLSSTINVDAQFESTFPKPTGFPTFTLDSLVVVQSYTAILILSPFVILALILLLRKTRFGLAIRATAANPDAAWTLGVSPTKVAGRTWAIAGAIAAFSAILLGPTSLGILGPSLLLRGLVAAAIARFENIGLAFGAGIGIGVLDVAVRSQDATSGLADVILAVVALVVLLARPPKTTRESADDGNWSKLALPRISAEYRTLWPARNFGLVAAAVALVMALYVIPLFTTNETAFIASTTIAVGIVCLSVLVLTGRAGQLSLGQFAIAGIASVASVKVVDETGVFLLGVLAAAIVGAVTTLVLGVPALRTRGLVFAITTLAFALATRSWILPQDWMMGEGIVPASPVIGGATLDDPREYYYYAVAMITVAAGLTAWALRNRAGRDLVALRDNENAARALGVPVVRRKVQAFLLAGALAGIGGSVFAHGRDLITPMDFGANASIDVVVYAVIGGLGVIGGPILGAVLGNGVPLLAGLSIELITILNLAFLVLILFRPGGVISTLVPIRDWAIEEYARLRGIDPRTVSVDRAPRQNPLRAAWGRLTVTTRPRSTPLALDVTGIVKSYGGIHAVRDVTLKVSSGAAVALIGPNGAGKTTFFEAISGFVTPDEGQVRLDGVKLTNRSPEARARAGLVRSFQNAQLFPTMTVEECVRLAGRETRFGRPRHDALDPAEVIESFGLTDYADELIGTLPTGLRRVTELACDVMLRPQVLLLDEPSAGIAHGEIPQLAALLRHMREDWGITLVIVDHDMNLLRSVCDRFVAMELGAIIAEGTAAEVESDPRVAEAFLGGNAAALDRSPTQVR
jgi:ABC-type branched-subunit amino acid transport system ATPase component/ABC-type branched-subunit amino acid transport system permease subunit